MELVAGKRSWMGAHMEEYDGEDRGLSVAASTVMCLQCGVKVQNRIGNNLNGTGG